MIHEMPVEWMEKLRVVTAEAEHYTPEWCSVKITLATKGGPRVGYTWGGKFRVESAPVMRTGAKGATVVRYWGGGIEDFRKIVDAARRAGMYTEHFGDYVIYMYRHCGVPKEWGVEAKAKLAEMFGPDLSVRKDQAVALIALRWLCDKLRNAGYEEDEGGDTWTNPTTGHTYSFK